MLSLVYVSSATRLLSNADLLDILRVSRLNNGSLSITGMLLYKEGNFMQVLEGPDEAVRQIYTRIAADPRHRGLIKLLEDQISERQFANWTMGFKNLDDLTGEVPGYTGFPRDSFVSDTFQNQPTRAQKLLLMFRDNM